MRLSDLDKREFNYSYFVWSSGELNMDGTVALSHYLQRPGAMVPATWRGGEVITREEARRRLASADGDKYNPWTQALMTPDEAELWQGKDELLYAAHWGVSQRPPEWKGSRWEDADALLHDANTDFVGVRRLMAAFRDEADSVRAAAKERATTAPQRKVPTPLEGGVLSSRSLDELILSCVSADELRRIVRWNFPDLEARLPGGTSSLAVIVSDLMRLLEREGLTRAFLEMLIRERPRRAAEIRAWM